MSRTYWNRCFIVCVWSILLAACQSDQEQINEDLINAIKKDQQVDEQEYLKLTAAIEACPESFSTLLDEKQQVIPERFVSYIEKIARNRKIELDASNVWTPENAQTKIKPMGIHVFVENSASMDGYVGGVTQFENSIYRLLIDLRLSDRCSYLNLNYINSKIINTATNATTQQTEDFIQKLEPSTFRQRGGDRSSSDLKNILETSLQELNDSNAVVLITDCVFSPGKGNKDAVDYLNNQQVGLKSVFFQKMKTQAFAFLMLQLTSEFRGTYYDRFNAKHPLNGNQRPYYVMIMATPKQMRSLLETQAISDFRAQSNNQVLLFPSNSSKQGNFKILRNPRIGNFEPDPDDPTRSIYKAVVSDEEKTKNQFGLSLAVQLQEYYLPESYLTDTTNYQLSNRDYHLKIEQVLDKTSATTLGYSHFLRLTTKRIKEEELTITFFSRLPVWISSSSSTDDTRIQVDATELDKTFGLKFFMQGIYDAYQFNHQANTKQLNNGYPLTQFSFTLKPAQ